MFTYHIKKVRSEIFDPEQFGGGVSYEGISSRMQCRGHRTGQEGLTFGDFSSQCSYSFQIHRETSSSEVSEER